MNVVGTHGLALGIVGKTRQVVLKRGGEEPMRGLLWAALVAGASYCLAAWFGWSGPGVIAWKGAGVALLARSEEHTSELQSLMRISYAVFCLKKKIAQEIKNHTILQ